MSESSTYNTIECIDDITTFLEVYPVAPYIKQEVKKILSYMNAYRLKNISVNKDFLFDYLTFIDKKNSAIIVDLMGDEKRNTENLDMYYNDLYYNNEYASDSTAKKVIASRAFISNITAMRGYILLTLEEFCHASHTRLEINKLLLARENVKNMS